MFKSVLLCHDGTEYGRRALKQGAELAIALGANIHVLIVVQEPALTPTVAAASLGHTCIIEEERDYTGMVAQSIERLKARGVSAQGHVAYGNIIEKIAECAKKQSIDLIVVGQYPRADGRRWWSGPQRQSLAESVDCAVLIAVNTEN